MHCAASFRDAACIAKHARRYERESQAKSSLYSFSRATPGFIHAEQRFTSA